MVNNTDVNPFRSQLQGASLRGLLVLAALGLVLGDAVLTNAALAELTPHQHHKDHLHHIAFLRAAEATAKVLFQNLGTFSCDN